MFPWPPSAKYRTRGSILVLCLLLVLLFFVLGMGLLGRRAPQYDSAVSSIQETQARALAEAGLEDARVKLYHDQHFPPPGDDGQERFSYRENLETVDGQASGYYEVTIDKTRAQAPENLLFVTSVGVLRSGEARESRKILRAEYDVAYYDRSQPPVDLIPNSQYLKLLRVEELGAP